VRVTQERLLRTLRVHPEGMTPALMAMALGAAQNTVSERLAKLFMYGHIDRRRLNPHNGQYRNAYVYFLKGC
jgi:predicted transcriptional regulator